MDMKLRGKIISGGALVGVFSMIISIIIISLVVMRQNRSEAIRNLKQGFLVIQDDLENRKTELLDQAIKLSSRQGVSEVIKYFLEIKKMRRSPCRRGPSGISQKKYMRPVSWRI
ncbi:MAG: hypothetical protein SV375_04580 [Thermodesulfobacteriota bacterium]|nr:hypothetical protein [Thermodesulfobacteriota bacterium]